MILEEIASQTVIGAASSRGLHYTLDHPDRDDSRFLHDTVIRLDPDTRKAVLRQGPLR